MDEVFEFHAQSIGMDRPGVNGLLSDLVGRLRWSQLMRRVFSIDVLRCHRCGGRRKLMSLLTDPPVVRRILRHLDLRAEPPPVAPARPRPQMPFDFDA